MQHFTTPVGCVAAFAHVLARLPHETRAIVSATDVSGQVWATVEVSPMTDTMRAVFPTYSTGLRGDTNRRGQSGIAYRGTSPGDYLQPLNVVIERARRMASIEL